MNQTEQYSDIENVVYKIDAEIDKIQNNLEVLRNLPFIAGCACPSHIERDLQIVLSSLKDINDTIHVLHVLSLNIE